MLVQLVVDLGDGETALALVVIVVQVVHVGVLKVLMIISPLFLVIKWRF